MRTRRNNPPVVNPKRGEIWRANLEPTVGAEIQKDNRPVLVLSRAGIGERNVRLCAPITDYLPARDSLRFWRVEIGDNAQSGLSKMSCADVSQTRALDVSRLSHKAGKAHPAEVEASAATLAQIVGVVEEESA